MNIRIRGIICLIIAMLFISSAVYADEFSIKNVVVDYDNCVATILGKYTPDKKLGVLI